MGKVTILSDTIKNPISTIGYYAGICWGANVDNQEKNYKRGLECIKNQHGRTMEFAEIYAELDGYSARVIREWYTHIGGAPTRLQASTRYIDYEHGFDYIVPPLGEEATEVYNETMKSIMNGLKKLDDLGVPREDSALCLPLGMTTKIVDRRNIRNVMDMSRQRECTRAYWEYRQLFNDYKKALSEYSEEWKTLIDMVCMPKCKALGYCPEKFSCGRMPKKEL